MAAEVKFVYFDVGSVIYKFAGAFDDMAQRFRSNPDAVKAEWRKHDPKVCKGEMKMQALWRELTKKFDYQGEDIQFDKYWSSFFIAIEETHQLVNELSLKGISVGLLTNIYPGMFELGIENGVIPEVKYASVVQSCISGVAKPEPQIYKIAQAKTGLETKDYSKILFIDDLPEYLVYPREKGWQTVLFDPMNPQRSVNEVRKKIDL